MSFVFQGKAPARPPRAPFNAPNFPSRSGAGGGFGHSPGQQGPPGPRGVSGAAAMNVFSVADYGGHVAEAAALANAAHGTLFIPPGTYEIGATPIPITNPGVCIVGCGDDSRLNFSGPAAIQVTNGVRVSIERLQLRGTNAVGQNGIEFLVANQRCAVKDCYVESVALGRGIYAKLSISLHLADNVIGGCQDAIFIDGPCGCTVERNISNYWADHGVWLFSANDDVGPRMNRVAQNLLHGNGGTAQDVDQVRAAVRISRVGSSIIEGNYIERVLSSALGELGHGVWLDGEELSQANGIIRNYFGPGTAGDLIRLEGLASHTCVMGNNIPTGETLHDSGLYTQFPLQHLGTIEQLTGTSTTRAGWIGLGPTGVVQLHS